MYSYFPAILFTDLQYVIYSGIILTIVTIFTMSCRERLGIFGQKERHRFASEPKSADILEL